MKIQTQFLSATMALAMGSSMGVQAAPAAERIMLTMPFGQSEVLAWSWGASQTVQSGGGGGAGKADFQDITLTRYTDVQSPVFVQNLATGHMLDVAVIERGALKISLENVLITAYEVGAVADKQAPQTENLSLNFQRVTYTVGGVSFCFNPATNSPC